MEAIRLGSCSEIGVDLRERPEGHIVDSLRRCQQRSRDLLIGLVVYESRDGCMEYLAAQLDDGQACVEGDKDQSHPRYGVDGLDDRGAIPSQKADSVAGVQASSSQTTSGRFDAYAQIPVGPPLIGTPRQRKAVR